MLWKWLTFFGFLNLFVALGAFMAGNEELLFRQNVQAILFFIWAAVLRMENRI